MDFVEEMRQILDQDGFVDTDQENVGWATPHVPASQEATPVLLRCNGCAQSVQRLHNLGGGCWRCLECVEQRELRDNETQR